MKSPRFKLVTLVFAIIALACGATAPNGAPDANAADTVFAAPASTPTPTPAPTSTPFSMPSPVPTSDTDMIGGGVLKAFADESGKVHINAWFQYAGGGDVGLVHIYVLLDGAEANSATCYAQGTLASGIICDIPPYTTLAVKITDATKTRSCVMKLPSRDELSASANEMTIDTGCDF